MKAIRPESLVRRGFFFRTSAVAAVGIVMCGISLTPARAAAPAEAAAVAAGAGAGAATAAKDFTVWMQYVRAEARLQGVSEATIQTALPDTLKPIPRVLELDRKQPEGTKTLAAYLSGVISKQRIEAGRQMMAKHRHLLQQVSDKYGVEPEVIVALWGIETSFGKNTGGYQVIPALATLAFDGRREAFFRDELIKALKIVDQDHIALENMKGSWAGAMGQIQFMPSSFFRFAQDFNGDGSRDIWGTPADIFASAANYLSMSGWQKGQRWGHEVVLPANIDRGLLTLDKTLTLQEWFDLGVRQPNGRGIQFQGAYHASIIQPDGPGTPAYAVYGNFRTVLKWNKSKYFGTAVGLLSDKLRGW